MKSGVFYGGEDKLMVPSALTVDGWILLSCELCVVQLVNGISATMSAYSLTCLYFFFVSRPYLRVLRGTCIRSAYLVMCVLWVLQASR